MDSVMKMSLDVKETSSFFWLRKIRAVNINNCCAKCFLGEPDSRMYHATQGKEKVYPMYVEMDVEASPKFVAYYLCGMSVGFKYENNSHIAFIYAPGEILKRETEQIKLEISNARWIDFESYVPNPEGVFTNDQRKCRNWIFANYLNDGKLKNF